MRMPFSKRGSDDGIESVFTPLLDALFLILVAIFAGYIVEVKSKIPAPIELPTDQYFASGIAELNPQNKAQLVSVLKDSLEMRLQQLKRSGTYDQLTSVNIEGYADAVPIAEYREYDSNEELSYFRALNIYRVVDSLKSQLSWDYPDSLFIVGGYGSRKLKVDTDSSEKRNRRIVIRFVFDKNDE